MKKFFSLLLVMTMLFSVCVPVLATSDTVKVLYTDSFEDKTVNDSAGGGWRSFIYSNDCARTGSISVKASGSNEQETSGILWIDHSIHKVTFEQGKTYSIRLYAMSAKTTAQLQVRLYDNDAAGLVTASNSNKAIPIGSWGEYVAVFNWGSRASTSNVDIRIDFGGLSDIYIDDLEIYEGVLNYDSTQWKDAEYTEIVPGSATTTSLVPDPMTLYDYSMDFEYGSSVLVSGKNVTATEVGNAKYKTQLIADPQDADNTVMKVWLASDVSGEGQYSGKNQNNYAYRDIKFSESATSTALAGGTIPVGATFKMSFRYYLPQEVESSNNPSFSYYYNTGTVRRLVPTSAPSTVHNQWHTVEMLWKNSTSSDQVITQGSFRLCGNNDNGNGWKTSWTAKGYGTTDEGVTFNFGDRAIYLDDFKITIEDSDGNIIGGKSSGQSAGDGKSGNLYVDKDAAAGGNGSKLAPFNTIEAARDYIRTIKDSMTGDIIVNVKGGRYEVENTIELTTADSGANGHYIIYQPYGYGTDSKEEVILSGGKVVDQWTASEIAGVYKAPLSIDYLRNLYVNDKRAQRARYNEYVTPIDWWDDTNITYTVGESTVYDGFIIPGGIIKNPEKATNLEIYKSVTFRSNWAVQGTAEADGDNTIIKMKQPLFAMQRYSDYSDLDWQITDNFRLENALEFLDEPGEWYHDADTGTLYYMPRVGEDINNCQVIAPNTEQILTIAGDDMDERAENIIVRGFTFSDGAYKKTSRLGRVNLQGPTCNSIYTDKNGAVYGTFQYETAGNIILTNAKNVSIADNVIKHMGGSGVMLPDGVDNCEVKGNAIYDISSSAVIIGSNVHFAVVDWRTVPRNVHITNNIIGNVGVEYGTDSGIHGYYTNGLVISHNEIYNTPYSGISVGWTWDSKEDTKRNNVIEYNRIYNYGTECQDGGGIYTLGRQPGSVVRGNYLKAYAQYILGLYHDSGSSGFATYGNVVDLPADTAEQGIYKNNIGDGDLIISENYFSNFERRFVQTNAATMRDNHVEQGAIRSPEALSIRAASGLESGYKALRDKVLGYSENTQIQRIYLQTEEQKERTPANIAVGSSLTLKTFGEGKNGEMSVLDSGLTYQVGDSSVLSINDNKITAVGEGITNVTVTDASGRSAQMLVTVGDEMVSFEVITNKGSATVDSELQVNYRLKTKYTEIVGFPRMSEMTINNTKIAKVLSDGIIKTVGEGVCTVSVNTEIGGFSVTGSASVLVSENSYRTFKMLNYMNKLTLDDIQSYLGSTTTANVSETTFVEALAAITETDSSEFCESAGTGNLTKEKMVAYAADALVSVYGVVAVGDSDINYYTDRAEISPSLVPKIALAYRNGLLSWVDGKTTFEPKAEMTVEEAAEFLYNFAHPENVTYLRMEDGYFNRYAVKCEKMYKDTTINGIRKRTKQWNFEAAGENCVDMSGKSGVSEGTDGVTIESGELVRKVVRNAYDMTTIVTFNELDYTPGKKYSFSFSAKLAPQHTSGSCNMEAYVNYPVASGTGTISETKINQDWKNFSMTIDIPEGTELTEDNNSIHIRLTNSHVGSYYYDKTVYTVLLKDIVLTEAATVKLTSSSIEDGETDVLTPIDSVYLYTNVAMDTSNVTTGNFSITGGASIRDTEVIDNNTIRVGIDGCTSDSGYTLSVSGIPCVGDTLGTLGSALNDTISWTTAPPNGKSGCWKFEDDSYTGTAYSGISSRTISDSYAKSGKSSLKVTTTALTNLYLNTQFIGFSEFEIGKQYMVSYSVYSPVVGLRTGICKHHATNELQIVDVKTVAANKWVTLSGVFTPTSADHVEDDIFKINIWGDPGDYYIDDIRITELAENPVTVYRPNVFVGGVPVSKVEAGNATVELKIEGGEVDREVWVVVAQYEDKNRMTKMVHDTATIKAGEENTFTINLSDAKNLDTKIFVMGKTSYEPYNDVICMDKKE